MKKMTWGVNGTKLNAYLKMIRKESRTAILHTVRDANDEDHVLLITDFLALKVPLYLYGTILQPYTMTDAPAFGESKSLTDRNRDGASLAGTVEDMMSRAIKTAQDTLFNFDAAARGKWHIRRLFALDDGTAVALDGDYAAIFERMQGLSCWGNSNTSPIVFRGPYVSGLVLPVRMSPETQWRADVLCASFAAPAAKGAERVA